jgi:DNA polymerase-1
VPPELIEERQEASAPAVGRRRIRAACSTSPTAIGPVARSNLNYDTISPGSSSTPGWPRSKAATLVALDTETTSLDEMLAEIVGLSFSVEPGEAAYIPLAHDYPDAPAQLPRDEVLARLKPWLENPEGQARPARQVRPPRVRQPRHRGAGLRARHHAAKLCARSAQAARPGQPGRAPPGPQRHRLRRPVRQGRAPDPFNQVDVAKAAEYSCEDSDQTLDVHLALWPQLEPTRSCASSTNSRCRAARRCTASSATAC